MIYVLNFKTYLKNTKEYLSLIKKLKRIKKNFWLALNPYFFLSLYPKIKKYRFKIGIQNLGPIKEKPQTGEIIYDFEYVSKADFVLLGHSERYRLGEDIEIIKEKIKTLQEKNLKLLIFFSENSYAWKESFSQVKKQTEKNLKEFLSVIKEKNYKKIIFVYEPWWAISTEEEKIPSIKFLEDFLKWYRKNYSFPIFYGGSFNSKLKETYSELNFDGFILGRSSANIEEILKL